MPRFVFKNIPVEDVKKLSKELVTKSAQIIECPEDWITFEHVENKIFFQQKEVTTHSIFLEISWFKRRQDVQDKLATYLYDALNSFYNQEKEITLIFNTLEEANYYEDGKNFI